MQGSNMSENKPKGKRKPKVRLKTWDEYNSEVYGCMTAACFDLDERRHNGKEYVT